MTENVNCSTLDGLASDLHKALFDDLSATGWHRASSCPYATAWVLLAHEFTQTDEAIALYKGCIHYLLQSQRPDGSWGRLLHEQLIMTPYAYVALRFAYGRSTGSEQHALQKALLAARTFLRRTGAVLYPRLPKEILRCFRPLCALAERAGHLEWVELIKKLLPAPAETMTLPAPEHICLQLSGLCDLLPALWQSRNPSDLQELEARQLNNGSWWCVSDMTAMALLTMEFRGGVSIVCERGWRYLLEAQNSDGGVPQFHDCELFLSAYVGFVYATVMKSLRLPFPDELRRLEHWLRTAQQANGLWSFTQAFPGGDLDDTSWIVIWLIDGCGVATSDPAVERAIEALTSYQLPDGSFPSWAGLAGDPDVTAHVLHALWATGRGGTVAEYACAYLFNVQRPDGSWQGTWHHSPIYGTAQVLYALARGPFNERTIAAFRRGTEYLLSQLTGEHSGWCGTAEETGMALWGLITCATTQDELLPFSRVYLWNFVEQSLEELHRRIANSNFYDHDNLALWIAQLSYTARPLQLAATAALVEAVVGSSRLKSVSA